MTYQETITWMFKQLPMYQNKGKSAYRKDLKNTLLLANHLKHPELKFKSVHVAGTNGKGSTSHMLASIFQEAGYKTGLYTSPHLKDFRERIKIDGKVISKGFVISFIKRNKLFFEEHSLSFFEMTVGLAFDYFAEKSVDIAIIEVGMGGRLDSTNIISPEVSVITNIGLDHTQFLGDTLEKIALEKAGIIKKGIPVVIGETQTETTSIFRKVANEKDAPLCFAEEFLSEKNYKSDLKGLYQIKNRATVLKTIETLKKRGYNISEKNVKAGLEHVVANTGLLGRWQKVQQNPKVICDTAHNREGLAYTMTQLKNEDYNQLHIVFGVVNDKNVDALFDLLPRDAMYYLCKPNVERGMQVQQLFALFNKKGFKCKSYGSVNEAYKIALKEASVDDLIYVGGSTFVVAEVV